MPAGLPMLSHPFPHQLHGTSMCLAVRMATSVDIPSVSAYLGLMPKWHKSCPHAQLVTSLGTVRQVPFS